MARKAYTGEGKKRKADSLRYCSVCPIGEVERDCATCHGLGFVTRDRQRLAAQSALTATDTVSYNDIEFDPRIH